MRGSLQVARVAGIGVFVHWTFLLLLGWIFMMHLPQEGGLLGAIRGVGLILSLFLCVLLHEFGHALMARRFDVPTKDITLLPIGGVARMERIPRNPNQEFLIAIAGPAVNVVIAAGVFFVLYLSGSSLDFSAGTALSGPWLSKLLWFNTALVVFNMVPAFPMDGGRVLRALLARKMDYISATQIAANIGQALALVFGVVGLFSNWILMFIALFVYFGARGEAQLVRVQDLARHAIVADAMMTQFVTLNASDSMETAAESLLAGSQHDFPVVHDGELVGLLRRPRLLKALESPDGRAVGAFVEPTVHVLQANANLEESLGEFDTGGTSTIPVLRGNALVGLLTADNLAEWISVGKARQQAAIDTRRREEERSEDSNSPHYSAPGTHFG